MLGDFAVSRTKVTPVRMIRTAERVRADRNDRLNFFLFQRGAGLCDFDSRPSIYGPGQVVLFDLAHPFDASGVGELSDTAAVTVGRSTIRPLLLKDCDLHGLQFPEAVGRMMADHMIWLLRRLPYLDIEEGPAVARATLGLFAACIEEALRLKLDQDHRDLRIRNRVGQYIDQNLRDPELAPDKICKMLGMSRSVLYRAFEPLAGIADYIRTRRLEAAHVLLEDPAVGRNISDIASEFGFASDAHFSRAFRQRYGYSPKVARSDNAEIGNAVYARRFALEP
jgi:AraC-like DNA-binding protein